MMVTKIPKMKKLTTEERNKLPDSAFADPKNRKYPIKVSSLPGFDKAQDLAYASAAKKRGAQQESMGNLSSRKQDIVEGKAERMLKKGGYKTQAQREASKGRSKPKSKINIDEAMKDMGNYA